MTVPFAARGAALVAFAVVCNGFPPVPRAESQLPAPPATPAAPVPITPVPWSTGEKLEYTVYLAGFQSGTGVMEVLGLEPMRGRESWRLHFNVKGSTPLGLYHVDDSYDSWMDAESLNSLRFEQHLYEGGRRTMRDYDIFPDRAMFHQEGRAERKSVPHPLDDASFFYFVRTLPLQVGRVYTFDKYFDPDANPVVIRVTRKDTVVVPAGRFPAIVLQPSFRTNGLFSENGHAEIWLSDDDRRILLQMRSHFSIISLTLKLNKATFGAPFVPAAPQVSPAPGVRQ